MPRRQNRILYLSGEQVSACAISPSDVNALVEASLLAKAGGRAVNWPTMTMPLPGGGRFVAKGGVSEELGFAAIKWFAIKPGHRARGVQDHRPLLLLSDARGGAPVAVMEASWITAVRTAAISAVAAKHMARKDSRSVGFIACGAQARSHLAAFRATFQIERVIGFSRRRETAVRFCEEVRQGGLAAEVAQDPRDAVAEADLIVTSVPPDSESNGFLDGDWVSPGTFAAMVDRGYSWKKSAFSVFNRIVTDDFALSGPGGSERLNFEGKLAGDLGQIVSGAVAGRRSDDERSAIAFSGIGLADAAVAIEVYGRARAKGLGFLLPL
jgi:ornithine cyclodeaminase/alanine dehydrogenase-like protein (mu-crystallin family)